MQNQSLNSFLKNRAKQAKQDFKQIPKWVLEAVNDFIESTMPNAKDKWIANAGHYLSDDDIEAAVYRIADHADEDDFIDDVDDVTVWEKVEFGFTCEQFLEHIDFVEDRKGK